MLSLWFFAEIRHLNFKNWHRHRWLVNQLKSHNSKFLIDFEMTNCRPNITKIDGAVWGGFDLLESKSPPSIEWIREWENKWLNRLFFCLIYSRWRLIYFFNFSLRWLMNFFFLKIFIGKKSIQKPRLHLSPNRWKPKVKTTCALF